MVCKVLKTQDFYKSFRRSPVTVSMWLIGLGLMSKQVEAVIFAFFTYVRSWEYIDGIFVLSAVHGNISVLSSIINSFTPTTLFKLLSTPAWAWLIYTYFFMPAWIIIYYRMSIRYPLFFKVNFINQSWTIW